MGTKAKIGTAYLIGKVCIRSFVAVEFSSSSATWGLWFCFFKEKPCYQFVVLYLSFFELNFQSSCFTEKNLQYMLLFPVFQPLQLDCDLCAIVSNSGQMAGQKVGTEIDKSSCIWRMNNAPTKGYEEDVGKRTTIRVVSHTSVPLLLKNPEYFFKETNNTVYVIWGPFRNMRRDGNGIVYNMLKKTVDSYPTAKIYVTTEKRMSYCDAVFKKETGKDR